MLRIVETIKEMFGASSKEAFQASNGWIELDPKDVACARHDPRRRLDVDHLKSLVEKKDMGAIENILCDAGFAPSEDHEYAAIELAFDTKGGVRIFVVETEIDDDVDDEEDEIEIVN